jgi:hypothetical protein
MHVIDHGGAPEAAGLANDGLTVAKFSQSLGEPCAAVLEAGWNWCVIWLVGIESLNQVQLPEDAEEKCIQTD